MGTAASSGLLPAGVHLIDTGKGILSAVHAISDNTGVCTVTVFDSLTASGKVLAKVNATVNTGSNGAFFTAPVRYDIGLTVQVVGGSGQGIVHTGA